MTVDVRRVGIIGAGQMGSGIAQVCAATGFDVVLSDITDERIKGLPRDDQRQLREIRR